MEINEEARLREMMNLINVYVDGLIGRDHPDYDDICQDAIIKSLPYLKSMDKYYVLTIFRNKIKDFIDKDIVKNCIRDEISIEEIDIAYPAGRALLEKSMKEDIVKILETLTPREETVIKRYFFDDKSLEEIARAEDFNLTRNRVRQIMMKALRKLQCPPRRHKIEDYVSYSSDPEFKQVQKVSDEE